MSGQHLSREGHWQNFSDPELRGLPAETVAGIIAARAEDLFAGAFIPGDPFVLRGQPRVTQSERGAQRMRAFILDGETWQEYDHDNHYVGVVAPDERGILYVERFFPHVALRLNEVYSIDVWHPDNSAAFTWREGEPAEPMLTAQAFGTTVFTLGRLARLFTPWDYDGPWEQPPYQFAHPDLRGDQLSSPIPWREHGIE